MAKLEIIQRRAQQDKQACPSMWQHPKPNMTARMKWGGWECKEYSRRVWGKNVTGLGS